MDLSKFSTAADEGSLLELKDPSTWDAKDPTSGEALTKEDGSPITIKLAGTDSARWRKAEDTVGDRRLKSSKSGGYKSVEEMRSDAAFMLASVTLAWDGIEVRGKVMDCNQENAKKLYLEFAWIREQVDTFVGERRNFLTASSQT